MINIILFFGALVKIGLLMFINFSQ